MAKDKKKKKMTEEQKIAAGWKYICVPYITRWGKRIYPKKSKFFKFPVDPNRKPKRKKKKD